MLAGVHTPDSGQITLDGAPVTIPSPLAAQSLEAGAVHQQAVQVMSLGVAAGMATVHVGSALASPTTATA